MNRILKNTFIIILIILNIILIFKINVLQTIIKKIQIQRNESQLLVQQYKPYIINNIKEKIKIPYVDIFDQLSISQDTNNLQNIWVVMIPEGVCMSCVSSLFSDLSKYHIPNSNLYLINEKDSDIIKKEWDSYQYKNYSIDKKMIFHKNKFDTNIILAKLEINTKQITFFNYNPELFEFLDYFIEL